MLGSKAMTVARIATAKRQIKSNAIQSCADKSLRQATDSVAVRRRKTSSEHPLGRMDFRTLRVRSGRRKRNYG